MVEAMSALNAEKPAEEYAMSNTGDGHHSKDTSPKPEPAPTTPSGPPLPPWMAANPPPDGGLQAWLHVVGAFMLLFNSWGVLNAFGVFQTYYESGAMFDRSSSDISWIGSIQSFMVLLMGAIVGPIYDRGYLRALLLVGSFLIVFGHMMLSVSDEYYQVLLSQGFVVGIGAGCLFTPTISLLPTYFSTRLGLALGIAYSGSSIGGVIYPIVLYNLLDQIGFGWSVRVMGFIALATLLIPIAVMRARFKIPKPRAVFDWSAFTDIPYMTFVVGTFIGMIGLTVFLFYLSYFSVERGLTSTRLGFYLVPILNIGSCFGRLIPNAISDRTGPFNMMAPCAVITGMLLLCMLVVDREASVIVMALLGGFFSGVFIALPPACFIPLITDKSKIGTRIGMGYGIISGGLLAGGPGAGAILGTNPPLDWESLWIYGGVTCLAAGFIYSGLRFYRAEFRLTAKV